MKSLAGDLWLTTSGLLVLATSGVTAQTMAPTPKEAVSQIAQLQELTKKIDEQNAKIDMLSQQILKLQLEISDRRPGVMIGEGSATTSTSSATTSAAAQATTATETAAKSASGNSHVVAR